MDTFKDGEKYLTKMSDGSIVTLTSVFTIVSGDKTYHTLKGVYAGDEHLGSCPIQHDRIERVATWNEYFTKYVNVRAARLFQPIEKKLKQLECSS